LIANPADVPQEESVPAAPIPIINEQGPIIWLNIGEYSGRDFSNYEASNRGDRIAIDKTVMKETCNGGLLHNTM
jgi:hypothetical protein